MEILLTILFALTELLDFITAPFFKWKARNRRQYLPPIQNDMLRISATELAYKIRHKEISSSEICQIYIDRIKEVNPILNAIVEERFKDALNEAKLVDSYLQTTSLNIDELEKIKPLLGVPVTIKECCSVKDMSLCVGLKSREGFRAESDGEIVARIKSSGAIVLLVTATPEMALSWETFSHINGYTNNPYDTTCTPGGSSGGEGALLGAGASLIGIGSDVAGSIRLPALFNGVFGHKPTPRVASIKGHWPVGQDEKYHAFLVIGPLARYACDLKLMMKVMCNDKICAELKLNKDVDLGQLNVFFMEDLKDSILMPNVSEDMKIVLRKSLKHLRKSCGSTIKDYKFESFKRAPTVCIAELYSIKDIPDALKWDNANFCRELIRSLFGKSRFTFNLMYAYCVQALYKYIVSDYSQENNKMKMEVIEKLGTNGVIILPTSIGPAHKHNQMFFKNIYAYLVIANALGLPSTAVPCGFDQDGMPIGVQIMAAPYQDRLCLAVAEELERHFGGWVPPPEKG